MKEVKTPRKPLAIYYALVLLMLLLLNLVLLPWMEERQIKEVDYGTFMTMTEEKNIGRVDIESNQIIFTDKDETQVYKTGLMNDTGLTERLYDAGATFSSEIVEQSSPVLNFLIWFVLPIILFSAIGNQMNKKLMEKAGGGPGSMMFGGMGKSNAKVYVQSTAGIRFADVAGEDEAIRAPARPCWPRPWQVNPTCPSSPSPARSSWRCSWAWVPPRCATCSSRPRRKRPASSLLMRSMPLAKSAAAANTAATMSASRP